LCFLRTWWAGAGSNSYQVWSAVPGLACIWKSRSAAVLHLGLCMLRLCDGYGWLHASRIAQRSTRQLASETPVGPRPPSSGLAPASHRHLPCHCALSLSTGTGPASCASTILAPLARTWISPARPPSLSSIPSCLLPPLLVRSPRHLRLLVRAKPSQPRQSEVHTHLASLLVRAKRKANHESTTVAPRLTHLKVPEMEVAGWEAVKIRP
jgi:hypothetical protein